MSHLPVQFLDQGLHRVLFNAMPMPVLVVEGRRNNVNVRVSAHPFCYERQDYVLLLLEGLNE